MGRRWVRLGYCPKCGKDVEADFCDECGAYTQEPEEDECPSTPTSAPRDTDGMNGSRSRKRHRRQGRVQRAAERAAKYRQQERP